ncbi:EF-P beta-lysylation protein EpmB [Thioflexithrix psekupsensis]|uniref:L-lysine 2,3-aminomutase n=1 Tax=Thioflexithrix psekupsensis TaxID=1570016 RepID=A0A251X8D5_9GAMM|nr:EF-P beta-lysylation protein EpmB [Thioflexithrix psekupsensis]OUD14185.1 EF-P beta-lysylation protein EpmB [Thioflexithrix psekupsensis]
MFYVASTEFKSWQQALATAITDPNVLWQLLQLPADQLPAAERAVATFRLKVTHSYCARMKRGDWHDPLLRQVLPLGEELAQVDGYHADPLAEQSFHSIMPQSTGILQKYAKRVLLISTGTCAVHCRYCFRRHFPYHQAQLNAPLWENALTILRDNTQIEEVILSGGDPLILSDNKLRQWMEQLAHIPHLKRVRFHTRLPIVLPLRINAALLDWISQTRLTVIMVIHANHANEFNSEVYEKLADLRMAKVQLLNQAVLLRGVNDQLQAQVELSEALIAGGVLPYYLHLLDKVSGAAHFDVPKAQALQLHRQLQSQLSGYLVPKLVEEIPGQPAKTWVF